jgi:hypothetical protein
MPSFPYRPLQRELTKKKKETQWLSRERALHVLGAR